MEYAQLNKTIWHRGAFCCHLKRTGISQHPKGALAECLWVDCIVVEFLGSSPTFTLVSEG
ncbi:hypothetical protein NECAME_05044 [Necator americanus]|uniref:Uncharacterized protein n=1 Tax=Necator americanus TaxID=51031 RepID=W2SM84_NECAM|nr:hypothetical protein NECAME_05044 [Necator americanus]ETN69986.1 hypothetical protein NECAME_05044 [Necator americanus]